MNNKIFGSRLNMARHEIKTPTKRGEDWAKAIIDIDMTEIGPVITVRLRHGIKPISTVALHHSEYIYEEIYQWLSRMRQHMHIARVVLPGDSPTGTWPPMNSLFHRIYDLGLRPVSATEVDSIVFYSDKSRS